MIGPPVDSSWQKQDDTLCLVSTHLKNVSSSLGILTFPSVSTNHPFMFRQFNKLYKSPRSPHTPFDQGVPYPPVIKHWLLEDPLFSWVFFPARNLNLHGISQPCLHRSRHVLMMQQISTEHAVRSARAARAWRIWPTVSMLPEGSLKLQVVSGCGRRCGEDEVFFADRWMRFGIVVKNPCLLVGGFQPTPLKNMSQLGWWHSQDMEQ